jgi:peptide chain release factor 3
LNNFGVEAFLNALIEMAPSPPPRPSRQGEEVHPVQEDFIGFVFKIQANMDPRHRDRMVFLRVCSGRFEKDMMVYHPRLGRQIRMSRPHRLFARDRETVEVAYPGDIIGLSNPGIFMIGDTVCSGDPVEFAAIPPFQPELFGRLINHNIEKYKQFNKGIEQLKEEGVVQVFYPIDAARREPILGAVGQLQFEVVTARLAQEYGVEARIEPLPYTVAAWVDGDEGVIKRVRWSHQSLRAHDRYQQLVVLFESMWQVTYALEQFPELNFSTIAGKLLRNHA